MKDFTTSIYITPIIDEIMHKYFIDRTTPEIKAIFKSDLVLTPVDGQNDAYFINKDRETLLPDIHTFINVFNEIDNFCKAAETTQDELFYWGSHEKDRVIKAAYRELLSLYGY